MRSLCFNGGLAEYVTGRGLRATIESIDNRGDFKVYMQNYAYAHGGSTGKGPRRDGPWEEGFVSALPAVFLNVFEIWCALSSFQLYQLTVIQPPLLLPLRTQYIRNFPTRDDQLLGLISWNR